MHTKIQRNIVRISDVPIENPQKKNTSKMDEISEQILKMKNMRRSAIMLLPKWS